MIRLLKNRLANCFAPSKPLLLGPLEIRVMEILWRRGKSNVRDVLQDLNRPLAYTTIMTTLERLFKKGLLDRSKSGRAFLYSPSLSREEWEHRRAGNLVADFLASPPPSRDLLLSYLLDAVGPHDEDMLQEMEKKIRRKRRELLRGGQP